jgi:hypothetical protein
MHTPNLVGQKPHTTTCIKLKKKVLSILKKNTTSPKISQMKKIFRKSLKKLSFCFGTTRRNFFRRRTLN